MNSSFEFETKQIRDQGFARLEELCRYLLPAGKKNGRRWKIGNLQGDPGDSCDVNFDNGVFGDFAVGGKMQNGAIDLWMAVRDVDFNIARKQLAAWLGISLSEPTKHKSAKSNGTNGVFDWATCVNAIRGSDKLVDLEKWRGLSHDFCEWLVSHNWLGLYEGCFAFPVYGENERVKSTHYLASRATKLWLCEPKGSVLSPMIIGDPAQSKEIHIHESTWDGLAFCDCTGAYRQSSVCAIITRGAKHGAKVKGLIPTGKKVFAWPQNDDKPDIKTGKTPSEGWFQALKEVIEGPFFRVETPQEYKDLNDWTRAGGSRADLLDAMDVAQPVNKPAQTSTEPKDPPLDFSRYNEVSSTFPTPISEAAFHGVAGHVVDAIAEQSEACREAILIQFLCAFSNMIGRSAYGYGGDSQHHPRIWTVLVGDTSKGRKGTAWNGVKRLLERLDNKWILTRHTSGASSGEGIIHHVRDPRYGIPKSRKKQKDATPSNQEELLDAGESDKRLLLIEEEFAQIFRVIERTGNTLSPVLRQAWDGSQLSIPNKNSAERATNPHVTVIGHITKEELSKFTGSAELFNGFANRFLWCASRRAQELPFSECVEWNLYPELLAKLSGLLKKFNPYAVATRLARNAQANAIWAQCYTELSRGYTGVLGGILNRAEAQVFRLSMLYALLDGFVEVIPEHLEAALAVWEYSVRSAKWIFGDSTGNWRADKILWELQRSSEGITRTKLNDEVFKRNSLKTDIDQALSVLVQSKLAVVTEIREGRYRTELWRKS